MANNAKINILLDFTTSSSLSNIKKQLESIGSSLDTNKLMSKGFSGEGAANLKSEFNKFSKELVGSFNENTGKFNFKQLQKGLIDSGINVNELEKDLLKAGISGKQSFDNIRKGLYGFNNEVQKSETLMQKLMFTFSNTARWRMSNAALNAFTNGIRDAYYFAKDLDRALTDISIVSGRTNDEMLAFADKANAAAKDLKTTTLAYTQAALVFYQQGLAADAVQKMTEATIIGANIAGESTEIMSELLTSTMNGYRMTAEEAISVTDKLAAVGATSAADFYELSTAMSKVSSIGYTAGVTIDELNAQIATIVSVTKGAPETVGHALKTIYTRMLAFRNESKGLMVDEEGETFGVPAVESALKRYNEMAGTKISLFEIDENGEQQLRDSGKVIEDIGNSWDKTTDKAAKFGLATALAGSRQQNNLIALFNAWDMYGQQLEVSLDAEGTALKQNAVYMESYEGHLKSMQAEIESLYLTIMNQDFLKGAVDVIASIVSGVDGLLNKMGGFPAVIGIIGGLLTNAFSLGPITKFQSLLTQSTEKNLQLKKQETEEEKQLAKIRKIYGEDKAAELARDFENTSQVNEERLKEIVVLEEKKRLLQDIIDIQNKTSRPSEEGTKLYDSARISRDLFLDEGTTATESSLAPASSELKKELRIFQSEFQKTGEITKGMSSEAKKAFKTLTDDLKNPDIAAGKLNISFQTLLDSLDKDVKSKLLSDLELDSSQAAEGLTHLEAAIEDVNSKIKNSQKVNNDLREAYFDSALKAENLQRGISTLAMTFTAFSAILNNETSTSLEKMQQGLGATLTTLALFSGDSAIKGFSEAFESNIDTIRGTEGAVVSLGARGGAAIRALGTAFSTAILPMLALQVATMILTAAFQHLMENFQTINNLKEGIQEINAEIGSLESKIQEIQNLGDSATEKDIMMVGLYEEQLKLQESLLKIEQRRLTLRLLDKDIDKDINKLKREAENVKIEDAKEPSNFGGMLAGRSNVGQNDIVDVQDAIDSYLEYQKEIMDTKQVLIDALPGATESEVAQIKKDITSLDSSAKLYLENITKGLNKADKAAFKAAITVEDFNDALSEESKDPIEALSELDSDLKSLGSAFEEFKQNGAASASTLIGIKSAFSNAPEIENFISLLGNSNSSIKDVEASMKLLLEQHIGFKLSTKDINEATIGLIGTQLKMIGVTNGEEVALKTLQKQQLINNVSVLDFATLTETSTKTLRNRIAALVGTGKALEQVANIEKTQKRLSILNEDPVANARAIEEATRVIESQKNRLEDILSETDVEINFNPTTTGGSKETADKWKEAFENELKDLKYSLDKSVINAEQYYKTLEKLNNKYFGKEKFGKYKEEFRQYELEVLNGLLDTYENAFKARFDNSIQWIEDRNKYSDWGADNEIAALQRVLDYTREAYAQGKILYKTYVEYKRELEDRFFEAQKEAFEKQRDLYEEQQDSVKDLLEATEELIKHEQEGQKKILEARKASLEALKDEQEFKDQMQKKTKALADLEFALKMAERDTTESGLAKQIELRQQIADAKEEITKDENDLAFELKQKELDDEIDAIEEYLDKTGKVTADAMERIEKDIKNGTTVLKEELIRWNRLYGTSIDSDITNMWESASTAFSRFSDAIRTSGLASVIAGIANEIKNLNEQLNKTSKPTQTQDFTKAQAVEMGQRARLNLTASGYTGPGIAELDLMDAKKAREWYGKYIPDHKGLTKEQKGYFLDIIKAKEAWAIAPYANGGISTNTHLALLHGSQSSPEWIFNNEQLKTVLASAVQSARSNPIISLPKAAGIDSGAAVTSNVTFDFANMITVNGNADATTVQALKESSTEVANMVINKINNQLKLNGQYVLTSK